MPPDAPGKILVPRWVQLVGLPLAIVGVWLLVSAVNHAVFVFVVAALIAILLNPIVRAFCALRIPRADLGAARLPVLRVRRRAG